MNKFIALLRGVNVGGTNVLPMKELCVVLEAAGFSNVKTYIQSGNIMLTSEKTSGSDIAGLINGEFGFMPEVLVLTEREFNLSAANNPYPDFEGKYVHFYFCKTAPKLDLAKLNAWIADTERYKVWGNVFYLHAPDGIGRSKLVANIETCLGGSATGRNLNTITKLKRMLADA